MFHDAEALSGLVPRFAPRHTANAWVRKDWVSGLNVAVGLRHVGEQFANNQNTLTVDGYAIASAAVGYHTPRWERSFNADNLFDKDDYFLPGHFSNLAFPGPPLSVTTSIRLKY